MAPAIQCPSPSVPQPFHNRPRLPKLSEFSSSEAAWLDGLDGHFASRCSNASMTWTPKDMATRDPGKHGENMGDLDGILPKNMQNFCFFLNVFNQ